MRQPVLKGSLPDLSTAEISPRLDGIGIEHSGFESQIAGADCSVLVMRFGEDLPGAGLIQKFSITQMIGEEPGQTTQYSVTFPSATSVNDYLENCIATLEAGSNKEKRQALEALDALVNGEHVEKQRFSIGSDGSVSEETQTRSAPFYLAKIGSAENFEKLLLSKQGQSAKQGWVESKYIQLARHAGGIPQEIVQDYATLFRKFGASDFAEKLTRLNAIDVDEPRSFPAE